MVASYFFGLFLTAFKLVLAMEWQRFDYLVNTKWVLLSSLMHRSIIKFINNILYSPKQAFFIALLQRTKCGRGWKDQISGQEIFAF